MGLAERDQGARDSYDQRSGYYELGGQESRGTCHVFTEQFCDELSLGGGGTRGTCGKTSDQLRGQGSREKCLVGAKDSVLKSSREVEELEVHVA